MIYSYTQIAHYLPCPRSYRYRYLDGWREKDTRAAMVFGRCFEKALGRLLRGRLPRHSFREWAAYRDTPFEYQRGESWDRLLHQGVHLIERFARDDRVRIPTRKKICSSRWFGPSRSNQFVSYIDAVGELDGHHCLVDWKTTTSRYPEGPWDYSPDPQFVCYSWVSGISDVALVVFVRKHHAEIQSLRATISDARRLEFGRLVETTIGQIEGVQFPRTAVSVSRRTDASVALIWDFVSIIRNWSVRI